MALRQTPYNLAPGDASRTRREAHPCPLGGGPAGMKYSLDCRTDRFSVEGFSFPTNRGVWLPGECANVHGILMNPSASLLRPKHVINGDLGDRDRNNK